MQRKHGRWGRGLDSAAFTGQPLDPSATQNQVNQHFAFFFIFIFFKIIFYRNIFSISQFTGLYPYRPAGGAGPTARLRGGRPPAAPCQAVGAYM